MIEIKSDIHAITAFAPATSANVAVGFDLLGYPIADLGDKVTLTRQDQQNITIDRISNDAIPLDSAKNSATVAIQAMCDDLNIVPQFRVEIEKGIPLSSGLGGSAASAVAAVVALNGFLTGPLTNRQLFKYALLGEAISSSDAHADNVAPCLFGGLTLINHSVPLNVVQLPVPEVDVILIHPHIKVDTAYARDILPKEFPLKSHIIQSAHLAGFMVGLFNNDMELMSHHLHDVLIEPHRASLVKGFEQVKKIAMDHGAIGCSFSGSGPSVFAWIKPQDGAQVICEHMLAAFACEGVKTDHWLTSICPEGASVIAIK